MQHPGQQPSNPHLPDATARLHGEDIKAPRLVRVLGSEFASNDEDELSGADLATIDAEFDPEAERRAIEADLHYNAMKDSGELERRRIESAYRMDPSALKREQQVRE